MKKSEHLKVNKETAGLVLDHLISKNLSFCWLENGRFMTRETCEQILSEEG